eukprot:6206407-Pleurochrysis_carterae.AAC.4
MMKHYYNSACALVGGHALDPVHVNALSTTPAHGIGLCVHHVSNCALFLYECGSPLLLAGRCAECEPEPSHPRQRSNAAAPAVAANAANEGGKVGHEEIGGSGLGIFSSSFFTYGAGQLDSEIRTVTRKLTQVHAELCMRASLVRCNTCRARPFAPAL